LNTQQADLMDLERHGGRGGVPGAGPCVGSSEDCRVFGRTREGCCLLYPLCKWFGRGGRCNT